MSDKPVTLPRLAAEPDERDGYEWNVHLVEADRPHMRICFMSNGPHSEAYADLIVSAANERPSLLAQRAAARSALEKARPVVADRAAGGRMLTNKEDAQAAFVLINEALSTLAQEPAGQSEVQDIRWAVNYLLEQIAGKLADWPTLDIWRSEAADLVRSFKHDLSQAPQPPGVTATRAPDEATELALRSRARKLLTNKGWTPGSNISLHSAIELLTAFGMELSRAPETDRCAYPECGCDFDATCNAAHPTVKVSGDAAKLNEPAWLPEIARPLYWKQDWCQTCGRGWEWSPPHKRRGDAAEMRERAAKECERLGDEIMARAERLHDEEEFDEYEQLECAAAEYSRCATAIRALPLTPEGRS